MSTGGKLAIGVVVAGGAAAAFYVVWKRRQAMLVGLQAQPVPVGITSQYSAAPGAGPDYAPTTAVEAVAAGGLTSIISSVRAAALAGGYGAPPAAIQSVPAPGPALSARTGKGHF